MSVPKFVFIPAFALALYMGGASGPAQAAPIFTPGNNPQADEENILVGDHTNVSSVTATTNQTATSVLFSNFGQNVDTGGQGQGFIESSQGGASLLTQFTFSVPGHTFQDYIFNPDIGGQPMSNGGTATVTVVANDGSFTHTLPLSNGNNFLTIVAGANEVLESVSLLVDSGSEGFNQLQQNRVSAVGGLNPVPEPGTLMLLGFGILGTVMAARRRRS
jgi:hypothetical protein